MAKFNEFLSSFIAGEVSPKVWARTNTELYKQACEEVENMIIAPEGGAMKRPPTVFSNGDLPSDSTQRLIPILTSRGEYLTLIMRPTTTADWGILDISTGLIYDVYPFSDATFTATTTEIHLYQYVVAGDRVYFSYKDRPPFVLKIIYSSGNLSGAYLGLWWQIDAGLTTPWDTRPYQDYTNSATLAVYLYPGATTGVTTCLAYSPGSVPAVGIFSAADVGTYIKFSDSSATPKTGIALVTGYNASSPVNTAFPGHECNITIQTGYAVVVQQYGSVTGTGYERESWNSSRGYPSAVTFFQDRIWYGGTIYEPDTIWGSKIGNYDYFQFRPLEQDATITTYATTASNAYKLQITTADTPRIIWMNGNRSLTIGSYNREYIISTGETGIGPGIFPQLTAQTSKGSYPGIKPVIINSDLFFVSGAGRSICNFEYNDTEAAYKSNDITTLGVYCFIRHWAKYGRSTRWKIKDIAYQSLDNRDILWVLDTCGGLTGVTIDKKSGVLAFHRHYLGGSYGDYPPKVNSICVVGNTLLVVSVKRKFSGTDKSWIEYITPEFLYDQWVNIGELSAYEYLDSMEPMISSTTTTFIVNARLLGIPVSCILNGLYIGELTPTTSGPNTIVTVDSKYVDGTTKYLTVGFKYSSKLITLPLEAGGSQVGSSQGLTKRIDQVVIRFFNTLQAKVSQKGGNVEELAFRKPTVASNELVPLFTDDKLMQFPSNYDRKSQIVIESDVPLALNVSGIAARGVTYD